MLLAYYSPLNPIPSGISDYSEELLTYLAAYAEIELIVDGYTPTNPALQVFPQRSLKEFYARASDYDVILYHMGNSPAMRRFMKRFCAIPVSSFCTKSSCTTSAPGKRLTAAMRRLILPRCMLPMAMPLPRKHHKCPLPSIALTIP